MPALAVVNTPSSRATVAPHPRREPPPLPEALDAQGPVLAAQTAIRQGRQLYSGWLQRCLRQSAFQRHPGVVAALPLQAIGSQIDAAREGGDLAAVLQPGADALQSRLQGLAAQVAELSQTPRGGVAALAAWDRLIEAALAVLQGFSDLEVLLAAHRAGNDALTGLPGRAALQQRLVAEHALHARSGRPCALAVVDLDHFKQINDRHGHLVGDRVLAEFARLLRASLRPYDGVYRYGGEEFVLILPGADAAQAARVIDRIRARLSAAPLAAGEALALPVQFSAGVAELQAAQPVVQSLRNADAALYQAKREGRNQVRQQATVAL